MQRPHLSAHELRPTGRGPKAKMVKFFISIRQRLLFAFLLLAIAGVVSSLWNVSLLLRHKDELDQLRAENLPVLNAAYEISRQSESIAQGASGVVLTRDKWMREAFVNRINDQFLWLDTQLAIVAKMQIDPHKLELIEDNKQALAQSFTELTTAIAALDSQGRDNEATTDKNIERLLLAHKFHAERMSYSVAALSMTVSAQTETLISVIIDDIVNELWLMTLYAIGAATFTALVVYHFDIHISRRVVALQRAMRAVADGDKGVEIPSGGSDEISDMGAALGTFVQTLESREESLQDLVENRTRELAEANARLSKSERRLRSLFEVASDWFCEIDKNYRITDMSPEFARVLSGSKVIGAQDLFEVFDAPGVIADPDAKEEHRRRLSEHAPYRLFEFSVPTPSGDLRHLQASGVPVFGADGAFNGYQSAIRDVTDHKNAELELRHSQKMQALGNLAGGVAHSFNNIFQPILILSELSQHELGPSTPIGERMQIMIDASRRGKALCDRILLYSRQDESKKVAIDLRRLIQTALELFRVTMPSTITLSENLATDIDKVVCDAVQIEAMFLNLTSNAVDAIGGKPGKIDVTMRQVGRDEVEFDNGGEIRHNNYVRLSVTDTGSGIAPDVLERIFDPFFTTKGLGKGTGLGLSMASGITLMHEGGIKVITTQGQGTAFDVYLPVIETLS